MSHQEINKGKTFREAVANVIKAGIPTTVFAASAHALGFRLEDLQSTAEIIGKREGPLVAGLVAGTAVNLVSIASTLHNLEGKITPGSHSPTRVEDDGTLVFQIACVDKRRVDQSGGALAGGYALFGSEPNSALLAVLAQHIGHDTPIGNFGIGYLIGRNIASEVYAHTNLVREVLDISGQYPQKRIKIEVKNHWDACGAQGFTGLHSWWLKFKAHQAQLADLAGLPNEVAGYIYTNGILSPTVALATGGRVSLSAVLGHSQMNNSPTH